MANKLPNRKKEIFRVKEPNAQRVLLAGDFTNWEERAIPMQKGAEGVWTASVVLSPGPHAYLFIADGRWREDPQCEVRVPNPYGGVNMVRNVGNVG